MGKCSRTLTFGRMLCRLSSAENAMERTELLEELDEMVTDHPDEQFLRLCIDRAKNGKYSVNIGRCLPPDMDSEDIFFEASNYKTIIAKW